jgi:hypothetical protein
MPVDSVVVIVVVLLVDAWHSSGKFVKHMSFVDLFG